ncbi:MAG: hypothetical protein AAGI23_04320 [Bacteroidota bacterium]
MSKTTALFLSSTNGNVAFVKNGNVKLYSNGSTQFDTLTIDIDGDGVNLSKDVMIGVHLELQNAGVILNDQDLTMADLSTIEGANTSQYIQTNGEGELIRPVADTDVTFPIGNSSYNPIILNNNGGTADFYGARVEDQLLENVTNRD